MPDSTTMTIRLSTAVKEKLGRLSRGTRRSKSYLAAAADSAYVDRELAIIEGIQRGLADVEAGRVIPHDESMNRIDAAIEAVSRKRKK
jgi:predicted transcriptional regulator